MSTVVDTLPSNKAQARPLTELAPDEQRIVWQVVQQTTTDGKVTAAYICSVSKAVINERQENRADRLSKVLESAPVAVVKTVVEHGVDEVKTVEILKRLHDDKRESFDELTRSGYVYASDTVYAHSLTNFRRYSNMSSYNVSFDDILEEGYPYATEPPHAPH